MVAHTNQAAIAPYGLLGRKLGHSWSPAIHQRLGSAPYELFEREPHEVKDFIREKKWRGLNVTIPYKRDAARLADTISPRVAQTHAANTLARLDDGSIFADNTDVVGFAWMLSRFCERELGVSAEEAFRDAKILVLGSGGASSAVCCALKDVGAKVVVVSRSGPVTYTDITINHSDAVLIVNTTPVGMYPDCPASPLPAKTLATLPNLKAVIDVIYNPERTGLCLAAESLGLPFESGLAMLVAQAAASSALWLGHTTCNDSLIETIESDLRRAMRNIVLIGMPGSGKTAAGRRLARLIGRPFADLDDMFEVEHGITPATCIRERGEDEFRHLETKIIASCGARSGLVIACGGGVVTRPENYALLHQNATIVLIDRPLAELSDAGRPLSQTRGIEALAAERMDSYRAWANIDLICTGSAQGDALALATMLNLR